MTTYKPQAWLHSYTPVPEDKKFAAFRVACEGGGTPPDWTRLGDDPRDWESPSDAAGGLLLFGRHGAPLSIEPPPRSPFRAMLSALRCARDVGISPSVVTAAYFSCGGQGVFLTRLPDGSSCVYVARPEVQSRIGAREENMQRLGLESVLFEEHGDASQEAHA